MKKFLFLIFTFVFCFAFMAFCPVKSTTTQICVSDCGLNDKELSTIKEQNNSLSLGLNAVSCVLIDFDTGAIIFEKNAKEKRPVASITKIMTLLVVYDFIEQGKCKLDDTVNISANAAGMGGSQAFLDAGSQHKLSDLLKTIIIASANDSCVAVAEYSCGSVESFVNQMNKKAAQIGLEATNFVNCTGLPALNQYSCALDCTKMLSELIRQKNNYFEYSKIWLEDYGHPDGRITTLTNTNKLSKFYEGCDGGKTGYTNESHHCLCATAKRGDTRFIACVLGEPDSKTRFAEVSEMLNYGFANYHTKIFLNYDDLKPLKVLKGRCDTVNIKPINTLCYFCKKSDDGAGIEVVYDYKTIKAPIKIGDKLGEAYLCKDGKVISSTDIVASSNVEKMTFFDSIKQLLRNW